jgi:amino acid permease
MPVTTPPLPLFTISYLKVVAAMFSAFGLHLLSICAAKINGGQGTSSSFYTVAHAALPAFTTLIDLTVAVKCFGVATSYLIILKGSMVEFISFFMTVSKDDGVVYGRYCLLAAFLFAAPLASSRTLNALRYTSTFSLIFVLSLVIIIVLYSFHMPSMDPCGGGEAIDVCRGDFVPFTDAERTLKKMTVFIFSFTCHQNIFSIVNEIQDHTQSRVNGVISISILAAMVINLVVSITGYSIYGSFVQTNVLLSLPTNVLVTVCRGFVAILMLCTYPLQCHPSRKCIISLIHTVQSRFARAPAVNDELYSPLNSSAAREVVALDENSVSNLLYFGITGIFLVSSFALAMLLDNLGQVHQIHAGLSCVLHAPTMNILIPN